MLPRYIWGRRHLLQVLEVRVVILAGDLKSSFRFSLDEVMQILDATNVIGQILGTQDWFHLKQQTDRSLTKCQNRCRTKIVSKPIYVP